MNNGRKYRRGWRNNYRSEMPASEAITKDIAFALGDIRKWLEKGLKLHTIVAYPDFPSKKTTLFKIADSLGYRLTNKLVKSPDVVIYFEDITHGSSEELQRRYPGVKILNAGCTDISKKKVDAVHLEVFGYNTFIDPRKHTGKAVRKSDVNALHDGRIIQCPVDSTDEKYVYQVVIDNLYMPDMVLDYRVPIIGDEIPHIYHKYKSLENRFTNEVKFSVLKKGSDLFTEEQKGKLIAFSRAMGADFCELDVLQDYTDGKIYVVDVNKTPYGPPFGLLPTEAQEAKYLLAKAFLDLISK